MSAPRQPFEQRLGGEIAVRQRIDEGPLWIVLKLSVVATSTCIRDGRSARAQTIAASAETSPDWIAVGDERAVRGAAEVWMRATPATAADQASPAAGAG